jgi:hypothetical protein
MPPSGFPGSDQPGWGQPGPGQPAPPPYGQPPYGGGYPPQPPQYGSTPIAPYGYQNYGQPPQQQGRSGMAITGFVFGVLSLLPCFWFWIFQIPGLLGLIFSTIGIKGTGQGGKKGRGLAIAGLVTALIGVAAAAAFTAFVYTSDDCVVDGVSFTCNIE